MSMVRSMVIRGIEKKPWKDPSWSLELVNKNHNLSSVAMK
jgi:hypothetical protein